MLSTETATRKDRRTTTCRMEHRHFATIARVIRNYQDGGLGGTVRKLIAIHFADELEDTNPNFNRARFLAACDAREG